MSATLLAFAWPLVAVVASGNAASFACSILPRRWLMFPEGGRGVVATIVAASVFGTWGARWGVAWLAYVA